MSKIRLYEIAIQSKKIDPKAVLNVYDELDKSIDGMVKESLQEITPRSRKIARLLSKGVRAERVKEIFEASDEEINEIIIRLQGKIVNKIKKECR